MKDFFRNTPGGKVGTIDGLNLFFGALLGANLGTMQALELFDYFKIIVLLAGGVMVIRMVSTSEKRTYALLNVAGYVLLLSGLLFVPRYQPKGIPVVDLHRLGVTLGVWLLLVLVAELLPVGDEAEKRDSPQSRRLTRFR